MINENISDRVNYIKRDLICKSCNNRAVTYEFFAEDIPDGFLKKGSRVLIGDNNKDVVPAFYLTSCNGPYPHLAIDDDGELRGKEIIPIDLGAKEL